MQLVHYQLFRFVEPHQFLQFHNNHIMRITPFVGIFMTIELLTALGLFLKEANKLWIANFILVLATWIMTGFWQGPMHIHLGRAYDPVLLELLIKTNYVRLTVWTLHAILVFIGMVQIQKKQLRKISI